MTIRQLTRRFWLCAIFAVAHWLAVAPLHAQKIGTIDLEKVFYRYYKTDQADVQLKERGAEAQKVLKGMLDDYQKAQQEYKTLSENAADQAVNTDERDKRKKTAESKLLELQEIERSVTQYRRDTDGRLMEQKMRMRDNVLRDIRERITNKARNGGYNLILDTSAKSYDQTQVILFASGMSDLTDEVLSELNATAPAGWKPRQGDRPSDAEKR